MSATGWAMQTMLSLEAGNAEPTPEQREKLQAMGIGSADLVAAYGRAVERIDAHHAVLRERLGEFTPADEVERMAARGALAVALDMLDAVCAEAES